jgi:quercetin dioxygenase-like cupin family protein
MKRSLAIVLSLAAVAIVVPLATAGGRQITGGLLSTGTLTQGTSQVTLSSTKGYVMEWAKVPPGASFGWHLHRTPVVVAITGGTATVYDSKDATCTPHRYSAGQGFVEPANHVHVMRNEGTKTVTLYAVYIGVPGKWRTNPTPLDYYVKSPGNCPDDVH